MKSKFRNFFRWTLGKNPVCAICGAPMMKQGYPRNGLQLQDYKCKLKTFTGYCCEVDNCEETAITGKDFCPEHLVKKRFENET